MVRIAMDRSSRVEPPKDKLPYKKHPIFHLRKLIIVLAIIGIFLSIFALGPYPSAPFTTSTFFLAVSVFFAMADLTQYAMKKIQHPDDEPEWPKLGYMIGDVVLALFLQFLFWSCVVVADDYYARPAALPAYAALCDLLCSLTHAYSFWKQLMARYKKKWLKTLEPAPCSRCGYLETASESEVPSERPPNTFPYAGPSASFVQSTAVTPPASSEAAMEEGLLIGSEFGSTTTSYGTIETPELTIDKDEQVVVSKAKKKNKAAVGKEVQAGRA